MSPERWQRIEEVYHSTLERAPERRAAFLAQACGTDDELRCEVESLLRHGDSQEALVDRPAWEAAGGLLHTRTKDWSGQTVSHYEVLEKLGEGGMGMVYKARDSRLKRLVALKVLPPEKVADAERKQRFVQEARSASALNHPNIVTVYDIDRSDGIDFIAMEYVEGKTLDELIGRKGLKLNEALKYAIQIADALSRAHAAGIVHRDLKPGNVMVTAEGQVKVLDFGVAKLTEAASVSPEDPSLSEKPSTESGMIVGTVSYMSPEQAEGKRVDTRSDIFSFGSLLYEMLTGRWAFRRESPALTLAAILHLEPPPLPVGIPHDLRTVIARCLRKDVARRYQHMDDVKIALEELKEDSESGKLSSPAGVLSERGRRARILVAGALATVMLGAGAWYFLRPKAAPPPRAALTRLTSDAGLTTDPVLSPDGRRFAYASDRESEGNLDIWIQEVATDNRLRLTWNEADEREPAFSPDGNRIAYRSEQEGGGIYVVPTLGGEPRLIMRGGRSPRFSPDGKLIAYWTGGWTWDATLEGRVFVIPSEGGQPRPIRADFKRAGYPYWLPDGRHLSFYGAQRTGAYNADVWVTSLNGVGTPAVSTGMLAMLKKQQLTNWRIWQWIAHGSAGGDLLLSAQSGDAVNIWKVPVSPRTFQVSGPPEQLTFGTANQGSANVTPVAGAGLGMVFSSVRSNADIWSLPLDSDRALAKGPPQRLTDGESRETHPTISEDGRKLVYTSDRGGSYGIWVRDLVSGKEARVNSRPGTLLSSLSRDGRRIVYREGPCGEQGCPMYMIAEGDPVLVCEDCMVPNSVTLDGEMLVDEKPVTGQLRVVMTARREGVVILKHPTWAVSVGRLSPDERWIAFHTVSRADARQVYVAPFRGPVPIEEKEWIPVTDGRGMERYADWSPDGNTLYFLSERDGFRCIRAQRLNPASKRPVGPPRDIYHAHHARRSLMTSDPIVIGLHIAADKAVFTTIERTGNIWMTELPAESR